MENLVSNYDLDYKALLCDEILQMKMLVYAF